MAAHRGDWFQTFSGRQVFVLDPKPSDIDLIDVAHALARVCRFGGHVVPEHYSVAQHSVLVSYECDPDNAFIGLLHDAAEAYLGDVIHPLKIDLPDYQAIEKLWERAIGEHFGLGDSIVNLPADVKRADLRLLATERRDLLSDGPGHAKWNLHELPMQARIDPWPAKVAEEKFVARYLSLIAKMESASAVIV